MHTRSTKPRSLTFLHRRVNIHAGPILVRHLLPHLPPARLALGRHGEIHKRRHLLITQEVAVALGPGHDGPVHERPRSDVGRPPNGPLHPAKDLAQGPAQRAVQLGPVAEARVDHVDDDGLLAFVVGREAVDEFAEEEGEEQLGGVVAVPRVEAPLVVQDAQHASPLLLGNLGLLECGPLRRLAAHDAEDWRPRGRCMFGGGKVPVGVGGGVVVLSLQDGPQGDGQEGGAEPVGLDGELVPVGDLEPEPRDAGVEDAEIDRHARRVSDTLRKGGDARIIRQVNWPDFDRWRGALAAAARLSMRGEQGGFGRLAFSRVADGEDEVA